MPLKIVSVRNVIRGAFVTSKVELTYINPSADKVLDCCYTYKTDNQKSFVTEFEASVETDNGTLQFEVLKSGVVE